jgi:hypothetical protein
MDSAIEVILREAFRADFDICVDARRALDKNVPDNRTDSFPLILECACVSDISR